MSVGNLDSGETLEMQYNPAEFREKFAARYTRVAIQGGSYQPLQYDGTDNYAPTFELAFDALADRAAPYDIVAARNFLQALLYPRLGFNDPSSGTGEPPRALFVWPNFLSVTCKVISVEMRTTRWFQNGLPSGFRAAFVIEEARATRLFAEDVEARGTQRGAQTGAGG